MCPAAANARSIYEALRDLTAAAQLQTNPTPRLMAARTAAEEALNNYIDSRLLAGDSVAQISRDTGLGLTGVRHRKIKLFSGK